MSSLFLDAIGLAAPGLTSWSDSMSTLRGEQPYNATPLAAFAPSLLPANEQRRATATVRIAFRVAEEALRNCGHPPSKLATVFASSDADMLVSHRICTALAQPQMLVSPTDFHNSVHNAPSGYWHIGARSHLPSSAVAGHDFSFAVGLLEAITQVQIEQQATLLVCYDVPAPEPLLERRPLGNPFAVSILLSPTRSATTFARIAIDDLNTAAPESVCTTPSIEALRRSNPAARALPLLEHLARNCDGDVVLRRSSERSFRLRVTIS